MMKTFLGVFTAGVGVVAFSFAAIYGFILAFKWSLAAAVRVVEIYQ